MDSQRCTKGIAATRYLEALYATAHVRKRAAGLRRCHPEAGLPSSSEQHWPQPPLPALSHSQGLGLSGAPAAVQCWYRTKLSTEIRYSSQATPVLRMDEKKKSSLVCLKISFRQNVGMGEENLPANKFPAHFFLFYSLIFVSPLTVFAVKSTVVWCLAARNIAMGTEKIYIIA